MQSLPLEAKIAMTQKRIEAWYESWKKYEIFNEKTGKTRFVTATEEPPLKDHEYIESITEGQVYVAFSGGKDSTVLKHIVDSMYSDVPAVFVNTGLEYPEIQKFVRDIKSGKWECFNSDVEMIRPEMRFDEVLKNYGYPVVSKRVAGYLATAKRNPTSMRAKYIRGEEWTKFVSPKWAFLIDSPFPISDACCNVMKKKPIKVYAKTTGRKGITAQMASESLSRERQWFENGCNGFNLTEPISNPLSFWTEQDILEYLRLYNLPYASVYGDIVETKKGLCTTGCKRTGCIFCCFGIMQDGTPNRFQRMKETHPRQYEYCINGGEMVDGKWQPSKEGLGLGHVLDYIGVKYD